MSFAASWDCPRARTRIFDAKHSPHLVLALFSRVLGVEQKDWPPNTLITGFCFYDADAGNAKLPPQLEEFLRQGEPPVVFTLGSAAVLAAGRFYELSARAAIRMGVRAVLLIGTDPRNQPRTPLPDSICVAEYAPYSELFPRAPAWWCTRAAWEPRPSACAPASPCSSCPTRTTSQTMPAA